MRNKEIIQMYISSARQLRKNGSEPPVMTIGELIENLRPFNSEDLIMLDQGGEGFWLVDWTYSLPNRVIYSQRDQKYYQNKSGLLVLRTERKIVNFSHFCDEITREKYEQVFTEYYQQEARSKKEL
jgi:hypothetical protein